MSDTLVATTPFPEHGRLDGKPKRKPSGRHAGMAPRSVGSPHNRISASQRLGFRIPEWAALLGISLPTVYRSINARAVPIIEINGVKFIPRAFAVEKGLITNDDPI